jgi:hypothetical protein
MTAYRTDTMEEFDSYTIKKNEWDSMWINKID